jgi:hypothetical protein
LGADNPVLQILQKKILGGSKHFGIVAKIKGREETPLAIKFLVCNDCNVSMTS